MSHLKLEVLARLADEAPDRDEGAHLARCATCRAELDALREQRDALGALPAVLPPPDAWPGLRGRLLREGMIRPAGSPAWSGPRRVAAALLLFLGGSVTGYAVRGIPAAGPAGSAFLLDEARPLAVEPDAVDSDLSREVERTQDQYFAALDRFMASTSVPAADPAARLAALDNIVLTTAEALNEAPADPVINSYYMTALAQRNAMLRQIASHRAEPIF